MKKKTKAIIADIVADILTSPVKAVAKCAEYAEKVKNIETKNGTVASDIAAAISKAKDAGMATKQKVVDKAKEFSESESGQKIINTAKDAYGKAEGKVFEYKEKVTDYIEGFKNKENKAESEQLMEELNQVFDDITEE